MPDVYATRSDLYKYGLPRGMLANPGRFCASALASTNVFELDGHGFETDDQLMFRSEAGGVLPDPFVGGFTYYAIRQNESTFKVAATPGGAPIDLTSDGTNVMVATPLPMEEILEFYSRFVDGLIPAHLVPLRPPYPITVTAIVAELAAKKLLLLANQSSQAMTEVELAAKAQLTRWATGMPLRDSRGTLGSDLAYSEAAPDAPTRNWGRRGVLP